MVGTLFAGGVCGLLGVHLAMKHKTLIAWTAPEEFLLILAAFIFSQCAMAVLDFIEFIGMTFADALMLAAASALLYDFAPVIAQHYRVSLSAPSTSAPSAPSTSAPSAPSISAPSAPAPSAKKGLARR